MTEIVDEIDRATASAAYNLVNSEAFESAARTVDSFLSEHWKTQTTTEDREAVFHRYSGFIEIMAELNARAQSWAMHVEATKDK